jgi:hypothetical protein
MATLLKVLNNLADIKSAGGVALRVRTQDLGGREGALLRLGASREFERIVAAHDLFRGSKWDCAPCLELTSRGRRPIN